MVAQRGDTVAHSEIFWLNGEIWLLNIEIWWLIGEMVAQWGDTVTH